MNELEKLKELLLANEKQALDAITRRLEVPESRAADIADVLPESVRRSHSQGGGRLTRALQEPVAECLRDSVRRDPSTFADVLFPVMGPAIRRAIAAAIKGLVQSINQTLETGLSPRRQISWRYQAWRAGLPLGEYVLQRTLRYRVEHAYLVQPESGLLMSEAHNRGAPTMDSDAVSAMLTVIQEFVRDSFDLERGDVLHTADLGPVTLRVLHGPHAMLACVVRGVAPSELRSQLAEVLETIHLRFGDTLRDYDGDSTTLGGVEFELDKCVEQEQRATEESMVRRRWPAVLLLIALGVWLAFIGWNRIALGQRADALATLLEATPGVVATQISPQDGRIRVRGLRDPLAPSLAQLVSTAGLEEDSVVGQLAPYQSLEDELVLRRANALLTPPAGVALSVTDGTLAASGTASVAWVTRATGLAPMLAGVDTFDASGLAPDDAALLAAAREVLNPPPGVSLTVRDAVLTVSGAAPTAWIRSLQDRADTIEGLAALEHGQLLAEEQFAARALATTLSGRELMFDGSAELLPGQSGLLDDLAADLRRLGQLAGELGLAPIVTLTGYTDGLGSEGLNAGLRLARANVVAGELIERGVTADWLDTRQADAAPEPGRRNPLSRKVRLGVLLADPAAMP